MTADHARTIAKVHGLLAVAHANFATSLDANDEDAQAKNVSQIVALGAALVKLSMEASGIPPEEMRQIAKMLGL